MPRKPDYSGTSWSDVAECVTAWEREQHCVIEIAITFDWRVKEGAYCEVTLYEANATGRGRGLYVERHPFNVKRAGAQAGNVLYALFSTLNGYDQNPWCWSEAKRRAMAGE